jgi:hypothetical protein
MGRGCLESVFEIDCERALAGLLRGKSQGKLLHPGGPAFLRQALKIAAEKIAKLKKLTIEDVATVIAEEFKASPT